MPLLLKTSFSWEMAYCSWQPGWDGQKCTLDYFVSDIDILTPVCILPAIDCELSEWSQWSECNKSCGKGHMIRTRTIQMEPQFGGVPCPETVQRKKCRTRKCLRSPSVQKLRWREARESRRSEQLREESDGEQFPGTVPWGRVLASRTWDSSGLKREALELFSRSFNS